jgi:hypothetical protein
MSPEEFKNKYLMGSREVWECRKCSANPLTFCSLPANQCGKFLKPQFQQLGDALRNEMQAKYGQQHQSNSNPLNERQMDAVSSISTILSNWMGTNDIMSAQVQNDIRNELMKLELNQFSDRATTAQIEQAVNGILAIVRRIQ